VLSKRNGVETMAEVVDGSPESIKAAIAAAQKASPGSTQEVVNPRAVVEERLSQPELPLTPGSQAGNPGTNMDDLPLFKQAWEPKKPNMGGIPSEELQTAVPELGETDRAGDFLKAREEESLAKMPSPTEVRRAGPVSTPVQDRIAAARERGITGDLTEDVVKRGPIKEPRADEPLSEAEQIQDDYDMGRKYQEDNTPKGWGTAEGMQDTAPELHQEVKQGWADFWKKTALNKYAVKTKDVSELRGKTGAAKGAIATKYRQMYINPSSVGIDTHPHELFHQWVADVQKHGNNAEKMFVEKAFKEFGGEEPFVRAVGEHFVKRLDKRQDGVVRDVLDFVKYKLGRATNKELERLGSNVIARGRGSVEMGAEPYTGPEPLLPNQPGMKNQEQGEPVDTNPQTPSKPVHTPRPKFMSAVDALRRSTSDKLKGIGDRFNTAHYNKREYLGKYERPVQDALDKLTPAELKAHRDYLVNAHDTEDTAPIEGSENLKKAVQAFRDTYRQIREDSNALGMKVSGRNGGEGREGKFDPTGMPHLLDPEVREMMRTQHDTPEWTDMHKRFVDYNTARGVPADIAEATWKQYTGANPRPGDVQNDAFYQAMRKAELTKLPPEMIDKNIKRLWEKYVNHVASDMAFFENFERDPSWAARVGVRDMDGETSLAGHPQVKAAMEGYNPTLEEKSSFTKAVQGGAGLVTAGIVSQPVTRVGDLVSTPFRTAGLVNLTDIPEVVIKGIANLAGAGDRARANGVIRNRNNYLDNMLNLTDKVNKRTVQVLDGLTKYTGSEKIERGARSVAQSFGEIVAQVHINNALKGDKTAIDFMDHHGMDWRTLATTQEGRERLGSRIALAAQGKFDNSNTPDWANKGGFKPFVSLARWSIEQQNNFRKFQLDPLMKHGDIKPMLSHLFMMAAGGVAVAKVRELLSGKKSYQPTFKEIENAPDKARAKEALALKLANYSQLMSTFGYMGDMLTSIAQAAGGQPVNQLGSPAVEFVNDVSKHTSAALRAIADGEDVMPVLGKFAQSMAQAHLGISRIAKNYWDKAGMTEGAREEQTAKNARRDYSVYKRLRGDTIRPFAPIPGYHGLSEKEFDRAPVSEASGLMMKEVRKQVARNPAGLEKKLRSLATIPDPGEGPSMSRKPEDWMGYMDYVGKTQGQSKADKLMQRLAVKEAERDMKRKMVPK